MGERGNGHHGINQRIPLHLTMPSRASTDNNGGGTDLEKLQTRGKSLCEHFANFCTDGSLSYLGLNELQHLQWLSPINTQASLNNMQM